MNELQKKIKKNKHELPVNIESACFFWIFSCCIYLYFTNSLDLYFGEFANSLGLSNFTTAIGMSALICFYAILTWLFDVHQKPHVIDSYYYLGFLLTLSAMITSFVKFNLDIDSEALDAIEAKKYQTTEIAKLIANNGIALTTTIVGMCIRLLIKMNLPKPIEQTLTPLNFTAEELNSYTKLLIALDNIGYNSKALIETGLAADSVTISSTNLIEKLNGLNERVTDLNDSINKLEIGSETAQVVARQAIEAVIADISSARDTFNESKIGLRSEVIDLIRDIKDQVGETKLSSEEVQETNATLISLYRQLNDKISKILGEQNARDQK